MKKSPKSHSLTCASTGRAAGSICLLTCHCQIGYFTLVISMWMRNTWPNNGKNWDFTIKTFSDFAARWDPSLKGCGRLFSTMVSNSLKLSVVVSLLKPYKIVKVKAKVINWPWVHTWLCPWAEAEGEDLPIDDKPSGLSSHSPGRWAAPGPSPTAPLANLGGRPLPSSLTRHC